LFAATNIAEHGWDGRILHCEEMPDDAPKGPEFWDFNKTAADVEYIINHRKLSQVRLSSSENEFLLIFLHTLPGTEISQTASTDPKK
jgi:hypothetical protein